MTDIVERLCETAGQLINGTMQDGDVEVGMLVDASDEIERLREILRSCVYGADPVQIREGEMLCLHLPNKIRAAVTDGERA